MQDTEGEDQLFLLVGYGLVLPGFVMVIAVVLATLRGRMEHTEELLGTLAVSPDRRSVGARACPRWRAAQSVSLAIACDVHRAVAIEPARHVGGRRSRSGGSRPATEHRPDAARTDGNRRCWCIRHRVRAVDTHVAGGGAACLHGVRARTLRRGLPRHPNERGALVVPVEHGGCDMASGLAAANPTGHAIFR